ncbi:MAG: RHS repeat-associated core domain-containing protein, partial [Candidatus Hydrogenedentes bacterium]|nr:RHS repeat-associated core domain-containing protein [Candidatus Hydrogenedentota bacterium]
EYEADTAAWDISGFKRFFVPKGHTAFAEAEPGSMGDPSTADYNYLAHDHLGTGRFTYNQAKEQIGSVEHDPYGGRITLTGYVPYHEFTGKPYDAEIDAYYFPFRYYNPFIARWGTPDPAGLIDGPNVYGYVKGNPVNNYDPLGLLGFDSWLGIMFRTYDLVTADPTELDKCIQDYTKKIKHTICNSDGEEIVFYTRELRNGTISCDGVCSCFREQGVFDDIQYAACVSACSVFGILYE